MPTLKNKFLDVQENSPMLFFKTVCYLLFMFYVCLAFDEKEFISAKFLFKMCNYQENYIIKYLYIMIFVLY